MKKNHYLTLIFIIVIISILFLFLYSNLYQLKEKKERVDEKDKIDLRISPNVNQGIILEITRIRHRGLLEEIMKPGNQWKHPPTFYFTCKIDDVMYNSRKVESANLENDEPFNTWDTMFLENEMSRDVKENQSTCSISLCMVEENRKGLLGLRNENVNKDSLSLLYDFRTGRWTGDDFLFDDDGYGHYIGDTFEIWFNIYQTDFDHDYIPYYTEVNTLSTDPCESDIKEDPDNDGIPTTWEWFWGYDPFVWDDHEHLDVDIDGIQNIEEYQMRNCYANPFQQNIYIEVDGMQRRGLFDPSHTLWVESQQVVIDRFAEHGITVLFDDGWPDSPNNGGGELLTHHRTISSSLGTIYQYYEHHFPDERKGVFRYQIIAHSSGYATASEFNMIDCFSIDTSKEIMWKFSRRAYTDRLLRLAGASATMHELGHTLGILPWTIEGCDNLSFSPLLSKNYFDYKQTWGQYESCMNYFHIWHYWLVDYSDGSNGDPYDQNDWLELYLPTFETELEVIEDPTVEVPATDRIVAKEFECPLEGWEYNESLTQDFIEKSGNWSPIEPIKCRWKIYLRDESSEYHSERNIRVYAQPIFKTTIVQPQYYSLIFEGNLMEDGSLDFGHLAHLIQS